MSKRAKTKKEKHPPIIGYMDGTDYLFELGEASDGNKVYSSVEAIRRHLSCVEQEGIVQVEVRFIGWAQKPQPYPDEENKACGEN